jgi:hypothetical protein
MAAPTTTSRCCWSAPGFACRDREAIARGREGSLIALGLRSALAQAGSLGSLPA